MNVKLKTLLALAVAAPLFAGSAIAMEQQSSVSVMSTQSVDFWDGWDCPPKDGLQDTVYRPWCS